MFKLATLTVLALSCLSQARHPNPIPLELWGSQSGTSSGTGISRRDVDPETLYPEYNLSVPVDHFHNESKYAPHSDGKFNLRYWFDDTYYKPGGPVLVLESGETDASTRLPYLQKGIINQLAKATGGMGVILEHRYYGTSFPTPDLSTPNLRFLTTDQALADTVYFAQNVVFKGHEKDNLTATAVPWIAYGGSYAGAFVAFLRTLYPGVFWGAISSSGVTEAIYDYWQYYEPVRQYGPPACISNTQKLTNMVDNILFHQPAAIPLLKSAFGLSGVTHNDDFANAIAQGIAGWQGRNWDPEVNDPTFFEYCGNMTAAQPVIAPTARQTATAQQLLAIGGYASQIRQLTTPLLNYMHYVNITEVASCPKGSSQDSCFGTHDPTPYQEDSLAATWRSWPYQYCQQWGFLQTGSGVPKNQLPLISRTLTLEYESLICKNAFNITKPSDTNAINKLGGFNIAYPRLAIVGGETDPWRPSTPLADSQRANWGSRPNDTDQPFLLISGAVHHWDENGLFQNETTDSLPPAPIKLVQSQEMKFVEAWVAEAKGHFPMK